MSLPAKLYIDLKRQMLKNGLFSCSQVGFNIARGPLTKLRESFSRQLSIVLAADDTWDTPPLIRPDWIETAAWESWLGHGLLFTQPRIAVASPKPLAHYLNRFRHHPASESSCLLRGTAFRDVEDTLPLLRQISFDVVEHVVVKQGPAGIGQVTDLFDACNQLAIDNGMELVQDQDSLGHNSRLLLRFADSEPVSVCTASLLSEELLAAYGLAEFSGSICSCCVERWCLAFIASHGADPVNWPKLT